MSLFGLRPEEPAAIRIREAATRGTLSHALLLTGSGDRMSAACFAAAALECTGEESRPCGVCPACRKVLAGIHPDVITVRDPDHKNIAVDVVAGATKTSNGLRNGAEHAYELFEQLKGEVLGQ